MNLPSVFGVVCIFAIQNILLTAGVTAGADASGWDAGSDWVDAGGAATVDADAGTIVPLTGGRTDGRPIDPCVASRKHARPLDTLETQCVNLRAHLPDNFDSALRLSELVLLSEELGRRQSVDMLDDLECLSQRARQAFDDPIETDAKAYAEKLRAYLNQLRGNPSALFDRSLPSKARTPLELRGEWNRTYYETYNQGATTGGEPETRLRYRLGLYCITHDPKWAIYLVDSYQETMRYKEAVDTISWIEQRQQDFDTELTSAVDQKLRMKAELAK